MLTVANQLISLFPTRGTLTCVPVKSPVTVLLIVSDGLFIFCFDTCCECHALTCNSEQHAPETWLSSSGGCKRPGCLEAVLPLLNPSASYMYTYTYISLHSYIIYEMEKTCSNKCVEEKRWQKWWRRDFSFPRAERWNTVLPLDAVKSMATVKLSCVLVGDGRSTASGWNNPSA